MEQILALPISLPERLRPFVAEAVKVSPSSPPSCFDWLDLSRDQAVPL